MNGRMPPVHVCTEPLYERQKGEGPKAWAAFAAYRDAGSRRSMVAVYRAISGRNVTKQPGQWRIWESQWSWRERAAAWDKHLDDQRREVVEAANHEESLRLADLRRQQKAAELEIGEALIERARQMLRFPIVEQTTELGEDAQGRRVTQIIKPGKWRLVDVAALVKIGVELRRLSLSMETARHAVTVDIEDDLRQLARERGFDPDLAISLAREFDEDLAG